MDLLQTLAGYIGIGMKMIATMFPSFYSTCIIKRRHKNKAPTFPKNTEALFLIMRLEVKWIPSFQYCLQIYRK